MKNESAVQFETESRIHMGLAVSSLEKSVAFYRTLFGQLLRRAEQGVGDRPGRQQVGSICGSRQ
ncbi:MAG: hypothetical protein K8R36_13015 [Planctomycetales bacterium]|nr:hypothetical protein [Planctomycetales bacterium]